MAGGQGCPPSIQQAWQVLSPGASARSPSAGAGGRWLQGPSLGPKLVIYNQGGKHWFSALYLGLGVGGVPSPRPRGCCTPTALSAMRTSVLSDVANPRQGLVAALLDDLQVAHLGHRQQGVYALAPLCPPHQPPPKAREGRLCRGPGQHRQRRRRVGGACHLRMPREGGVTVEGVGESWRCTLRPGAPADSWGGGPGPS